MSESTSPLDAASFERHAAFVRRLARRLESDEAAADDLAQETWLAALSRSPGPCRLRAWLGSVLRNKFAERHRVDGTRRAHETARVEDSTRDGGGADADTADLVERMELQQVAVRAVLELPEPYRDVLVHRFSRGEDVDAIARRLGLPEATVRTRLRRGLERLRERLRADIGGTHAFFVVSLGKLASKPDAGATAKASLATGGAGTLTWAVPLMAKKLMFAAGVILSTLALVWSLRSDERAPAQSVPHGSGAELASAPEASTEPPIEVASVSGDPTRSEASDVDEVASTGDAVEAPAEPPVDDDPYGEVVLRVEDEHGVPISQAKLYARQWRSKEDPATSTSWGDDADSYMGESGPDGVVRLRYRKHHSGGDVGLRTVANVGFEVTHPEYQPHEENGLDVNKGGAVIVLKRGAFVIVSGWIGSPDRVVANVTPHLSFGADSRPSDWMPVADGRPSSSRIPPGVHSIYLAHRDTEGRDWYSDVVEFQIGEVEQKELSLELRAPVVMTGVLDESVPRPVTGGRVELNLYVDGAARGNVMLRTYDAEIDAEGRFRFDDLPPGSGEIIALCDGWASTRTRLADSNWTEDEDGERQWQRMWQLQQVDPARHAEDPYVLKMEPTGDVLLEVLDPDGNPIDGASVNACPNVQWEIGYSAIFMDHIPKGRTDDRGRVRLGNMPAGSAAPISIVAPGGYRLPRVDPSDEGSRRLTVTVDGGGTKELTVLMDPAKD